MNKAKELLTTTNIVKEILLNDPNSRSNDNYLYYKVYAKIGREKGIDVNKMSMPRFFLNLAQFGFPSTETIRRTRQKLQATYPELAGSAKVEGQRLVNEEIFRDYARKVTI